MNGYQFRKDWNVYPVAGECDFVLPGQTIAEQLQNTIDTGIRPVSPSCDRDDSFILSNSERESLLTRFGWYFDSKFYRRVVTPPYSLVNMRGINLDGPYNQSDGYGTMTEQLTIAFKNLGYGVFGSGAWTEQNDFTNLSPYVMETLRGYSRNTSCGLRLSQPDSYHACPSEYKVIYTMWEFPLLPERWYDGIKNVDLTIVPCGWNKVLWEQVQPNNTVVIPLGINPKIYYPVERPERKVLTFLTDGSLLGENNIVEIFNDLFGNNKDVKLIVKMKGEKGLKITGNVIELIGRLTSAEMLEFYKQGDVFLYPTHAEGFGLFPLEAMATGLPVIATDNPAMKTFMSENHSYPVKVKNVDWYHFCDMNDMAQKMLHVYNNFNEAKEKGKKASEFVAKNLTWKNTAEKIIKVLS